MSNPFLDTADMQQNAFSKARDRAAEKRLAKLVVKSERDAPMVASPSEKATWEAQQLMKKYNAAIRQRRADLLAGPHGQWVSELLSVLADLSASTPEALIAFVERATWLHTADRSLRLDILSIISGEIANHRIRQGLAPFDDSLWDEPPTVFEIVRKTLTGVGA